MSEKVTEMLFHIIKPNENDSEDEDKEEEKKVLNKLNTIVT